MFSKSSLQNVKKMRTKGQHIVNRTDHAGDRSMSNDLMNAFARSRSTLLPDAVGVVALAVMLVVGLHLPGLI